MAKVEVETKIEILLIQVLQHKQMDPHPVLLHLSQRLTCLNYLIHSKTYLNCDDNKDYYMSCINEKYLACFDMYKEFKISRCLQSIPIGQSEQQQQPT